MTNVRCPVIKICHVSVTNLNFGKRGIRGKSLIQTTRNFEIFHKILLGEVICTPKIDNDLSKNR